MQLRLPDSRITISSIARVELTERCNRHSRLEAWITCSDPIDIVLRTIGQSLEFSLDVTPSLKFRGIIGRIEALPHHWRVTAYGPSYRLDLLRRTRFFDCDTPKPISKFDEITKVFSGVGNLNALSGKVEHISQFEETDWQLLVRLARHSGASIVTTADKLRIVGPWNQSPKIEVNEDKVIQNRVTVELGLSSVETTTWDWQAGSAPTTGAVHSFEGSLATLEGTTHAAAARLLPGGARHRFFPEADVADDDQEAKRRSSRLRGRALRWLASFRDLSVAPGDVVSVTGSKALDTPLVVIRRTIVFDNQAIDQMSIEVEAMSAEAAPDEPESEKALFRAIGEVVSVDDPLRLGRIKVHFPWHVEKMQGTWCRSAHAAAGKNHGTFNPPETGDWVITVQWPTSFDLPLVLGASYRGSATVYEVLSDLASQRAILLMPRGQRIIADDRIGDLRIGVYEGTELACELSFTKDPAAIKLLSAAGGRISMKADIIEIETLDSVKIKGKVSIE